VQLGTAQAKLKARRVEVVGVVNTPLERGQLYFKYRPTRMLLAGDPDAEARRQFRLPAPGVLEVVPATATAP
jgi:hypothetical protein